MPRTTQPMPVAHRDNFDPAKLEEAGQAALQLQQLQAGYGQGRDLVNQMLGQIQMSRAISKFTDVVSLSKLKQIKESKMYRAVAGQKGLTPLGEEIPDVGTWEGFCKALGLSVSKVDEDLTNLNAFGEDALNQLNSVGLGYRDLRQFRRLPADQKTALIEAAKLGDKDSLLELAEDLIAKHTKEKEALVNERDALKGDYAAVEKVLADKEATVTKLEKQLSKLQSYNADETAAEQHKQMVETLGHEMLALHGQIAKVATVVQDIYATGDTTTIDGANEVVRWAFQSLADVALKHGIDVDFKEVVVPEWLRPMLSGASALQAAQTL